MKLYRRKTNKFDRFTYKNIIFHFR